MPETTEFAPGTFCWVESGTTDIEKAKPFYAALFGWEYATADDTGYTMCLLGGKPVAGLYAFDQNMLSMGALPYWLSYVAVADADAAMGAATAAGAQPVAPVFDVPGHGRGGAFTDPTGAMCGIWQGRGHKGFGRFDEHGTVVWCELQTRDTAAAGAFYSAVFGWRTETMPMPDGPYHLFRGGEDQRGGMMAITPEMGEAPSHWQPYFQVADADAAAAKAVEAGGAVVNPVMDVGGVGRMAVLRSADGAHFSILQPAPMA
jgi:predicted enzyme related to lactoylglutathione lyase